MDGKRAAPRKGRRVVFAGIRFLCRAGPMCPAEKCVPGGGARGPRPTGEVRYPPVGDVVPQGHLFRCAPRQGGVSDGITRRPAGMRLRVAPIRLTTFRDAGMIAVVPSHS